MTGSSGGFASSFGASFSWMVTRIFSKSAAHSTKTKFWLVGSTHLKNMLGVKNQSFWHGKRLWRSMELWSVWVYSKHYTLEDERLEPTNHPWKERKMIWTKPLWLCSMLIFRGENDKHSKRSDWNISTPCDLEDSGVPNSSPSSGEIDHP